MLNMLRRGKRKAEDGAVSDSDMLPHHLVSSLRLSSTAARKQARVLASQPFTSVPDVSYLKCGKLYFEYGASVVFKVLQAAYVLGDRSRFNVYEQLAHITHAHEILTEAQDALQYGPEVVTTSDIDELVHQLAAAEDDIKSDDLREIFRYFQTGLPVIQDSQTLEQWHHKALTFFRFAGYMVNKYGLNAEFQVTCDSVDTTYQELFEQVGDRIAITDPESHSNGNTINPNLRHNINLILLILREGGPFSGAVIELRFEHIRRLYQYLDEALAGNTKGTFDLFTLYDLADATRLIAIELAVLLCRYDSQGSLRERHVSRKTAILCQGCRHMLVSRADLSVQNALASMFEKLQHTIATGARLEQEHHFTVLAQLLKAFTFATPAAVQEEEWAKYAPRMLSPTQAHNFMNKLQYLHHNFQNMTYTNTEVSRIWLTIWRGLKATYLIVREDHFLFDPPGFPAEQAFFKRTSVRNQFEMILSAPEAAHPDVVENVVAEYCIHIAQCHKDGGFVYAKLKQLHPSTTGNLAPHIIDTVRTYANTREWNDVAIIGMQKCVLQLNHILDGPTFVRRVDHNAAMLKDSVPSLWKFEKVSIGLEGGYLLPQARGRMRTQSSPFTFTPYAKDMKELPVSVPLQQLPNTTMGNAQTRNPPLSGTRFRNREDAGAELHGQDVVSAFDYVVYPFPETRALEVAQSRQITREMSSTGIHSPGALEHDVINRPPRHTWPPGKISIWASSLPTGPVSVLKEFWATWRNKRPRAQPLARSKPHPHITSRRPRKEWADEHPRLKPLLDLNRRVTKRATRSRLDQQVHLHHHNQPRRHSHLIHVPKLRGGGGQPTGSVQPQQVTSSDDGTTNDDQIDIDQQDLRVRQLVHRLRGFWRGGDVPRIHYLRQCFLIPNRWNVDAAHQAARRFVDYGLLDGRAADAFDAIRRSPRSLPPQDLEVATFIALAGDPFVDLGVNPDHGLNPIAYGLPVGNRTKDVTFQQYTYRSYLKNQKRPPHPITPTPETQSPPIAIKERYLDPPIAAHLLHLNGAPTSFNAANGPVLLSSSDLPAPLQAFQVSPGRQTPVPQQSSPQPQFPALNQQHQAQIDRQQAGLPSTSSNDDSSIQENRTTQPQRRTPGHTRNAVCNPQQCHPCPHYTGMFHHICHGVGHLVQDGHSARSQTQYLPPRPLSESSSFTHPETGQNTASLRSDDLALPYSSQSDSALTDDELLPLVNDAKSRCHIQPAIPRLSQAVVDGTRGAVGSVPWTVGGISIVDTDGPVLGHITDQIGGGMENVGSPESGRTSGDDIRVDESLPTAGASVGISKHNLRDRSRLAKQHADKIASDKAFEQSQTTAQHAQDVYEPAQQSLPSTGHATIPTLMQSLPPRDAVDEDVHDVLPAPPTEVRMQTPEPEAQSKPPLRRSPRRHVRQQQQSQIKHNFRVTKPAQRLPVPVSKLASGVRITPIAGQDRGHEESVNPSTASDSIKAHTARMRAELKAGHRPSMRETTNLFPATRAAAAAVMADSMSDSDKQDPADATIVTPDDSVVGDNSIAAVPPNTGVNTIFAALSTAGELHSFDSDDADQATDSAHNDDTSLQHTDPGSVFELNLGSGPSSASNLPTVSLPRLASGASKATAIVVSDDGKNGSEDELNTGSDESSSESESEDENEEESEDDSQDESEGNSEVSGEDDNESDSESENESDSEIEGQNPTKVDDESSSNDEDEDESDDDDICTCKTCNCKCKREQQQKSMRRA